MDIVNRSDQNDFGWRIQKTGLNYFTERIRQCDDINGYGILLKRDVAHRMMSSMGDTITFL
jgi:hypothetical protein